MRPFLTLGVTLTAGWCALSLSTSCAEGNEALVTPLSSAAPTDSAPSASVSAFPTAGASGFGGMNTGGNGGFGGMLGTAGAGGNGGMGGAGGGGMGGVGDMDGSVGGMPPQGPAFAEVHEIFTARCSGGNCHSAGDQGPSRARFASGDLAEAEAEATGLAKGSMLGEPVPEEMVRRINLEKGMADFMPAGPAGMKLPPVEIDLIEQWAAAQ